MILIAVLLVGGSLAGWALEVAHPAFFAREPVVLWTHAPTPAPTLFFCGRAWPAAWRTTLEEGRVRWETCLGEAPVGVWLVCVGQDCFAFLRVEDGLSLVEIVGAPPGSQVSLDGVPPLVIPESGASFLIACPGQYTLTVEYACAHATQTLRVSPGERRVLRFGELLGAKSSAVAALPGHRLRVTVHVRSLLPLPYLRIQASLPPGWRIVEEDELFLPVPAGPAVARGFVVEVPTDAEEGVYELRLRWYGGGELRLSIPVRKRLSPWVVVGHWDVRAGRLDLTAPYALTFERALWAASLLGRPIPYTAEVMTPELLHAILEAWASGAGG